MKKIARDSGLLRPESEVEFQELFRAFENFLCVIEHSPAPTVTLSEEELRKLKIFLQALRRAGEDARALDFEEDD